MTAPVLGPDPSPDLDTARSVDLTPEPAAEAPADTTTAAPAANLAAANLAAADAAPDSTATDAAPGSADSSSAVADPSLDLLPISFGVPPGYRLVAIAGRVSSDAEIHLPSFDDIAEMRARLIDRLRRQAAAMLGPEAVSDAGSAPSPVGAVIATGFSFESSEDSSGIHLVARAAALVAILSPSDDAATEVAPIHTAIVGLAQMAAPVGANLAQAFAEPDGEVSAGLYL